MKRILFAAILLFSLGLPLDQAGAHKPPVGRVTPSKGVHNFQYVEVRWARVRGAEGIYQCSRDLSAPMAWHDVGNYCGAGPRGGQGSASGPSGVSTLLLATGKIGSNGTGPETCGTSRADRKCYVLVYGYDHSAGIMDSAISIPIHFALPTQAAATADDPAHASVRPPGPYVDGQTVHLKWDGFEHGTIISQCTQELTVGARYATPCTNLVAPGRTPAGKAHEKLHTGKIGAAGRCDPGGPTCYITFFARTKQPGMRYKTISEVINIPITFAEGRQ